MRPGLCLHCTLLLRHFVQLLVPLIKPVLRLCYTPFSRSPAPFSAPNHRLAVSSCVATLPG